MFLLHDSHPQASTLVRFENWLLRSGIGCTRATNLRSRLNLIKSTLVHITIVLQKKLPAVRNGITVAERLRINSGNVVSNRLRAIERDWRTAHEQTQRGARLLQPKAQIVLIDVRVFVDGTLARLFVVHDCKAQVRVRAARFRHRFGRITPGHRVAADGAACMGVAFGRVEGALLACTGVFLRCGAVRLAVCALRVVIGFIVIGPVATGAAGVASGVPAHAVCSGSTLEAVFALMEANGRCTGDEGSREEEDRTRRAMVMIVFWKGW